MMAAVTIAVKYIPKMISSAAGTTQGISGPGSTMVPSGVTYDVLVNIPGTNQSASRPKPKRTKKTKNIFPTSADYYKYQVPS